MMNQPAVRLACIHGELSDQVAGLEALQLCLFRNSEDGDGLDTLLGNCVDKIKGINNGLDRLEIELRRQAAPSPLDTGEESPVMLSALISRLAGLLSAHGDIVVRLDGEQVGSVEYVPGFQDPASALPEDYSPAYINIGRL